MLFELAEKRLGKPGLAASLTKVSAPHVRSSLSQLTALIEAGELDYAFEYRSTAVERGLKFLEMPPALDFGDERLAREYGEASFEVTGAKPGEKKRIHGTPIHYAIAVTSSAAQPALAREFVRLVLSAKGKEILTRHGFVVFDAPIASGPVSLDR